MRRTTYLLACLLLCLVTLTAATPPTAVFQEEPLPPPSEPTPTMEFQPPSDADEVADFVPADGQLLTLSSASTAQRLALPTSNEDVTVSIDEGLLAVVVENNSFADPVELEISGLQVTPVVSATAESVQAWFQSLEDGQMVEPHNHPTTLVQFQLELFSAKTGEQLGEFDHPVRLMVDLRELGLTEDQIASPNFYLAYRDEKDPNLWRDVPITIHQAEGLISAELTHFSDWAAGWRPTAWAPSWTLPAVSEFSGAATYSYPIEVPPGRGGLQPNLALSYSSRSLDGAIGAVSQGNVASGWSIGDSYIIREGGGLKWESGFPYGHFWLKHTNNYRLVLNGVGYELIPDPNATVQSNIVRYYAKNMPSLKVVRLYYPQGDGNVASNDDGIFWSVTTGDGTKYRFGYFADSEAWERAEGGTPYAWGTTIDSPIHPGHHHASSEDVRSRTSAYAWHLDTVTDVHGNQMTYHYDTTVETRSVCGRLEDCLIPGSSPNDNFYGHHKHETVRLIEIKYNYPSVATLLPNGTVPMTVNGVVPNNLVRGTGSPATKIEFVLNTPHKQIVGVKVFHGDLVTAQKEYKFALGVESYDALPNNCSAPEGGGVGYRTHTNVVEDIQVFVGGYSLPKTILTYTLQPHFFKSGDSNRPCFGYAYLESVDNGYGGKVQFSYVSDGRSVGDYYYHNTGTTGYYVWPEMGFSYSVSQVQQLDRGTAVQEINYSYTAPCYNQTTTLSHPVGATTCPSGLQYPEYGPLVGYATTTSTIRVPNGGEELVQNYTEFYQHDPIIWWDNLVGKPKQQETRYKVSTTGGAVFRPFSRTITVYESEPFGPNLPFVFAQKISQYQYSNYDNSGNNPKEMSSKTEYTYDLAAQGGQQWGMVTEVREFATAAATAFTRKTNTLYVANTSGSYWMIKPAAVSISNANNQVIAGTWNYYDNIAFVIPPANSLALGLLTRTRQFSPYTSCAGLISSPPTNCVATIEARMVYGEGFGNVTETWSYQGYGYVINNGSSPWGEGAAPTSAALKTIITYDTGFKLYPISVQNPALQTTSFAIYGFGYAIPAGSFMKQNGLLARVDTPNGVRNWYEYDPFGRLFATYETYKVAGETTPTPPTNFGLGTHTKTDGNPTQRYHYYDNNWQGGIQIPFAMSTYVYPSEFRTNNANHPYEMRNVTYYDGFGRAIQSQERTVAVGNNTHNQRLIATTSYDALGQVACQAVPYHLTQATNFVTTSCATSPNGQTLTTYGYTNPSDTLIHPSDTLVTAPDGTTSMSLNRILTYVTVGNDSLVQQHIAVDANNRVTSQFTNSRGQLILIREYDGTYSSTIDYADTQYYYDVLGNMIRVERRLPSNAGTGTLLATTTMSYDGWGRKTSMSDPDMGSWSYNYDAAGNLTRQIDGNGQALCFYYDTLNRLTTKGFPDSGTTCPTAVPLSTGTNWIASYTYASSGSGIGQVSNVVWRRDSGNYPYQATDSESFTYDSWGRVGTHSRTISGLNLQMSYQYDVLHRPSAITYPSGQIALMTYDRQGEDALQIRSVTSGVTTDTPIVNSVIHNSMGQITNLNRAGSNLSTVYSYYGQTSSNATMGNSNYRLSKIQHGTTTDSLPDFSYQYDKAGNIRHLTENYQNSSQFHNFQYDAFNRLMSASTPNATGMATGYNHSYSYNTLGNLMSLTDNNVVTNYQYQHPTKKQAVTSTSGGNTQTFGYDGNGNMTSRVQGGISYTQTFDRENRLVRVVNGSANTRFYYDANGQRTTTVAPDGTFTFHHFPGVEWKQNTNFTTFMFAGQAVVMSTRLYSTGSPVYYHLFGDHLGSASTMTTLGGSPVQQKRFLPFGAQRVWSGAPNSAPWLTRGYTGHMHNDEVGLIYMNARYYVPSLGRFASADTIVPDPSNPQQFNRFSYVLNNPLRFTDPTGHLSEDEIETYFGFTNIQQMIDMYGEAIAHLLWGTSFTWGDVMAYACGECDNGVGYAMLLLLESSAGSEIFRGAFWGIDAIHIGRDYRGIEVNSTLLGKPGFAEKSISKTENYQNNWGSIPINRSAYGMGQDGNNMLAGTWADVAFWRPVVFVGSFFIPGAKPASVAAKWIHRVLEGWTVIEEVTDDITEIGHPLGEYLTVYPTIRGVNTLNPHSNNTYTFLAPNGR